MNLIIGVGTPCIEKLANILSEKTAVVSADIETPTLTKADKITPLFDLEHNRSDGHGATPRNENINTNDRGGILHIYGDPTGTVTGIGIFAPAGFARITTIKDESGKIQSLLSGGNNVQYFYSASLGVYMTAAHLITQGVNHDKNAAGSIRIGNLGGKGLGYVRSTCFADVRSLLSSRLVC